MNWPLFNLVLAIVSLILNAAVMLWWRREYIRTRQTRERLEKALGGRNG